eukprot:gene9837-4440_t
MIRDEARNAAYDAALRACPAVRGGGRVVDVPPAVIPPRGGAVGCGAGLLSFLALRAGAGSVVGIEAVPRTARLALRGAAANAAHGGRFA